MAGEYVTQDGDMIDAVVWRTYPGADQAAALAAVYDANRGLAEFGPSLPGGLRVTFPELPPVKVERITRIWG